MKCIIFDDKASKGEGLHKTTAVMVKPRYEINDVQLSVINNGAVSISTIANRNVENTLILHTPSSDGAAIDLERVLCERTNVQGKHIKLIDINELVENVIPREKNHFSHHLGYNDYGFVNNIQTVGPSNSLEFKTVLKYETIIMTEIRDHLMNFVQQISKIAFFLERNPSTINSLSEYLAHLMMLTQKHFDCFPASQFQQITSVAKHASIDEFNECYYKIKDTPNKIVESIIKNIELIKKTTKDRNAFNFKGMKIYLTSKSIAFNLLGTLFNNPNPTILNMCLAHIMMCEQLNDFSDKLERTKLLYT